MFKVCSTATPNGLQASNFAFGRPLTDQTVSRPMQGLHVELILALQFDKSHRWSRRRLRDPLGVAIVVLLRRNVGSDVFRRHQPDVVAVAGEDTPEVM
jgi:hypothetical protein